MALHSDSAEDVATASNFREVRVKSYELHLKVDFDSKQIQGTCILPCIALKQTQKVVLDTHESVKIQQVEVNDGKEVTFSVSPFTGYGSSLHIELDTVHEEGSEFTVKMDYSAGGGPGICWLDAVQTAGKQKPYMYTQGQAVMNRSLFPCQDTPAVKAPYSATVQVPEGFTAVMSANSSSRDGCRFSFEQSVPVQVYLVALAVGDLASAEIGPRSRVYTEPCLLEAAQSEFGGVVEEFITTGEELFGPYVWGRYDILVMPPSFPFGGMENPCLTFVTPCLLVGDKSLTDVVIHEICHSWFGNLVTNATWSDFWLNEGFTMFAQRRIMEKIFGAPYTCLETQTGRALLRQHMDHTGEDHPLNRLRVIIEPGVDPDDTYNETPYEKGFMFVTYLQTLVGDASKFDQFLKSYVDKYKYKSVVAEDTLEYFFEYFPDLKSQGVDKRSGLEFDKWLNTPGWPAFEPDLCAGRELTLPAEQLAEKWVASSGEAPEGDLSSWKTYQLLHFLDTLLQHRMQPEAMKAFVKTYPTIVNSENAEVCLRWSQIVIQNDYQEEFPKVTAFLHRQGKQKYTLPVYKAMMKGSSAAKQLATNAFQLTKDQLHVQVRAYVEKILSAGN